DRPMSGFGRGHRALSSHESPPETHKRPRAPLRLAVLLARLRGALEAPPSLLARSSLVSPAAPRPSARCASGSPPGRPGGTAFPPRSFLARQSRRRRAPRLAVLLARLRGALEAPPSLLARSSLVSP